eukprot:Pgem_evm1s19998
MSSISNSSSTLLRRHSEAETSNTIKSCLIDKVKNYVRRRSSVTFADTVPGLSLTNTKVYNVNDSPSMCSPTKNNEFFYYDDEDMINVLDVGEDESFPDAYYKTYGNVSKFDHTSLETSDDLLFEM